MHKIIQQIRSNDFLRHNGIFFLGSLLVSALNYLYYPVLGRLMTTSDFGEVQALVSLFLQANIFLNVVTNVAVNIVTNERDERLRNRIVYELERFSTVITLGALALVLVFVRQLQDFLRFEEVGPFFALAAALLVSVPLALRSAYLRGRSAFGRLSVANVLGALTKIIFSAGLVLFGWRTLGAIGGLVAAQLVALAYAVHQARRLGLRADTTGGARASLWRRPDFQLLRPQLPYALLVLVVSLVLTTLFSFDVIAVKHYFTAEIAGQYAGIATIARIIYFLTGSIAAVLLSVIKLEAPSVINQRLLKRSIALQLGIGGAALMIFAAVPELVTRLLIGAKYLPYAHLLPKLSLALFTLAFASLLFYYDLALRRTSAAVVSILGAIAMFALVIWQHATLEALVNSLLTGALVMVGLRALDSLRRRIAR